MSKTNTAIRQDEIQNERMARMSMLEAISYAYIYRR
jgi:hypothetical protein